MRQETYNALIEKKDKFEEKKQAALFFAFLALPIYLGTQYLSVKFTFDFFGGDLMGLILAISIPFLVGVLISEISDNKNRKAEKQYSKLLITGLLISVLLIETFNIYTMVAQQNRTTLAKAGEVTTDHLYQKNLSDLELAREYLKASQQDREDLKTSLTKINAKHSEDLKAVTTELDKQLATCESRYTTKSKTNNCKRFEDTAAVKNRKSINENHQYQVKTNDKERLALLAIIKTQQEKVSGLEESVGNRLTTVSENRDQQSLMNMINPHNIGLALLISIISNLSLSIFFSKKRSAKHLKTKINQVKQQIISTSAADQQHLSENKSAQNWEDEIYKKIEAGTWEELGQRPIEEKTGGVIKQARAKKILLQCLDNKWVETYKIGKGTYFRYPQVNHQIQPEPTEYNFSNMRLAANEG